MWLRYASVVSFVSLLLAFGATLLLGWSYTQTMPVLNPEQQKLLLMYSVAVAVIAWPIWIIHWYLVRQDWVWESRFAQNYLIFFTVIGMVASVVVGVQLLVVLMKVAGGESMESHQNFIIGAGWAVAWSLAVWLYHGVSWVRHRRIRNRSSEPTVKTI
jgi:uncharacterized protein with PQ loop repeat